MGKYIVTEPFEHNGQTMEPGKAIALSGRQAKYLELNGKIRPAAAAKPKKTTKGGSKK